MIDPLAIASYVAADQISSKIDADDSQASLHEIHATLREIKQALDTITQSGTQRNRFDIVTLFPGQPLFLHYYGRQHIACFASAAISVQVSVVGVGSIPLSLISGWNNLDLPEGTELSLPAAATPINVLLRYSDSAIEV